jgi:hypothetical protein
LMTAHDGQPILNGGGASVITNAFMNLGCINRTRRRSRTCACRCTARC